MPRITVSLLVNADSNKVFKTINNIDKYPDYMKYVKLVKIKENRGDRIVSKWTLDMDGTPIKWIEEDIINQSAKTMSFKSLKGDYGYEGMWQVVDLKNGHSKVIIDALFDWGVPNFEHHFGKVYERKARLALTGMLKAIKRVSENG